MMTLKKCLYGFKDIIFETEFLNKAMGYGESALGMRVPQFPWCGVFLSLFGPNQGVPAGTKSPPTRLRSLAPSFSTSLGVMLKVTTACSPVAAAIRKKC